MNKKDTYKEIWNKAQKDKEKEMLDDEIKFLDKIRNDPDLYYKTIFERFSKLKERRKKNE